MGRAARDPRRQDGRVAVVTGASSGIGRRLALDLAAAGATVVGIARRAELLDELVPALRVTSPHSGCAVCDVADTAHLAAELSAVEEQRGRIDIMVNCAGDEYLTPVAAHHAAATGASGARAQAAAIRRLMEVNYFGTVAGTLAVLPGMLARGEGTIVNVASDAARAPEPGHGAYAASKAAVAAFTESVAHEVAGCGVRVHVLYPGWVPTAMGLSGMDDGGKLPPRLVRRSEAEVSALVLRRMGGDRVDINAAALPLLAAVGRVLAPGAYARTMRRFASTPGR